MRSRNKSSFYAFWALLLIVLMGAGFGAFAQGKGKGGGGGNKGGGGDGNRGGGRPQMVNPGPPQRQERQQPQAQPRGWERQAQRQQPQYIPAPVQRQPDRGGWQNPGRAARIEQPRPQPQPQYRVERQRRPDFNRIQPQPQYRVEQQRRPDFGRIQQQLQYRIERGSGNRSWKQEQRAIQRNVYTPPIQGPPSSSRAWPNNYGYQRSTEVHLRNAERKAFKDQEKMLRRQARIDGRTFDERSYRQNVYQYRQREAWRENVLRSVVSNVLVNNNNYYYTPQPQYQTYSYGSPYDYGSTYYYGSPYNQAYYDNSYGYNYYDPYPQYQSFYGDPYYYGYQPAGYGYSPYYGGNSYYGGDPYYSYGGDPYYSGGLVDQFPLASLFNSGSGGGFVTRLLSGLLAYGYDQGYRDGLYARRNGYGEQYYQDPFAYADEPYGTYSFFDPSYSVGENREYLSEGYGLGYEDALYRRNQYDPYRNGGNLDLVSMLLGSVLQMAG